jgi:RNA polymerase sigma-70 factor (ECF subfamily)
MTTIDTQRLGDRTGQAMAAWHRFSEVFEPLRPELYRYCRALTRSAWDAEDLVQDALARALVTLGCVFQEIDNPRAWLFRVASNVWIDRQRRSRESPTPSPPSLQAVAEPRTLETRDAGATLIGRLSPQERAAVLLKDVFDFTLDETAVILTTTPGAVKAALHRGRGKLAEPDRPLVPRIAPVVLDAFCDAFNARDIDRLVALMLDTATAEIVGIATEYGPQKMRQSDTGSLYHALFSPISHAVAPEFRTGDRGGTPRAERRSYRDEPIIVHWYDDEAGPVARDVVRIDVEDERIARIRYHFFSPDVLADVCSELELPWRSNGYRYWVFGQ